ncbi:alpha/beta hydrolase [Calidifontibacter sp. DB0510]|uniref:Alpha/beta hydrolase n=1 Tax=Metallococcus carri TaxID=1656884 RepID=A0A967EE71_9MICO|nr:alpha/beta hydrolase [Metallococcus carri]NHN55396.1 alpha/beta hydrolase [Metallococcus carri]NOP36473.1 alpha/beta hydrolase [Calidifontibacter sp. DB2511S]
MTGHDQPTSYRDQQSWRDLQTFLPPDYRLDDSTAPEEEFWAWRGHRVHLERYARPESPVKVVLHHGVGTNGRQMSLVLGHPLAASGIETVAVDNLGYGLTQVDPSAKITYDDWVELMVDFVRAERQRDDRPLYLFGLSAGGMLAYHVAARMTSADISGIVGMTFLDQRDPKVRRETARFPLLGATSGALAPLAASPLGGLQVPMSWPSKMSALANDPGAMKVFMADRTSAANRVSVRFLHSYMSYTPAVEPAQFATCPVLLTQPELDRWTPARLSEPVLSRIQQVPVERVTLGGAGHYPLEQPGLTQLHDAVHEFVTRGRSGVAQ